MEAYIIAESDDTIYSMGLTVGDKGIHVCGVFEGEALNLVLFDRTAGEEQVFAFSHGHRTGSVFHITLEGKDFSGLEYCFEGDGKRFPDPCGRMFSGREKWGDLNSAGTLMWSPVLPEIYDWEDDKAPFTPYEDSIIYRAHVRGFTKHVSSRAADKGTFRAVESRIPYLKDLGITALELMPVNEFEEVVLPEHVEGNPYGQEQPTGRVNYWGYTNGYYFAPKASYSSGRKKNPVRELKSLVKALHKASMELIVELYFTGKENPSFVLETARFWVREYHVDGIHLVGNVPAELIGDDPYLSDTKLLATSWETNGSKKKHLAEYNDGFLVDMRRVLKGDEDQMNNLIFRSKRNPKELAIINYLAGTNGFTMMDMVSYDTKHNEANGENNQDGNAYNYSWNCGVEGPTRKKKIVDLRKKQIRNAMLLLFLSQGTPLLMAGDEFGNSQSGNNNAYCQDNEISWLNWGLLEGNRDLYDFVRCLIQFRKDHPIFHMKQEPRVMDYMACGHPDVSYHGVRAWCPEFENFRRQLGIMYCGDYVKNRAGKSDDFFFLAINMHWESHEFALPNLPKAQKWHIVFHTDDGEVNGYYKAGEEPEAENQKQFPIPPRTIVVFKGMPRDSYSEIQKNGNGLKASK